MTKAEEYLKALGNELWLQTEDPEAFERILRERLLPLLEAGQREYHAECEDGFYSCPKAEVYFGPDSTEHCSCGKDAWDTAIENLVKGKQ